ncbi:MAG: 5'-methylthioadenosine/S-adenosylhomocysteine nucleosidase, partial [Anaerotignum sp.]|nr:5'-methylthioadenosine/S-adenosylhomocysteine nucleosidase [Anaerotignum sp.]
VGIIPRLAESYFKADEMMVQIAQEAAAETADDFKVILGRVASGDQFIGTKEGKEKIQKNVQGDCAEMEGAAIAHACWLNRIPFVVIRAISDGADEEADMSFDQFCKLAAKRSSDLVEKMLEKV